MVVVIPMYISIPSIVYPMDIIIVYYDSFCSDE